MEDAETTSDAIDLATLFPSSTRRPMGTLGGFEEVMRVRKKRAKRAPKPRYDPTPKLVDDDLVALPAIDAVGVAEEDDYDDLSAEAAAEAEAEAEAEAKEDIEETDADDSPQITEVGPVRVVFSGRGGGAHARNRPRRTRRRGGRRPLAGGRSSSRARRMVYCARRERWMWTMVKR